MKYLPYLGLLAAFIVVAFTYRAYGREEAANIASEQALIVARAEGRSLSDSLEALQSGLGTTKAKVDTLWRTRTVTLVKADTWAVTADSLVKLASDTLTICHPIMLAYEARTSECAELRKAVALDSQAIQAGQSELTKASRTIQSLQSTSDSLSHALGVVQKPYTCHLLPFIPCPGRVLTLVLGGVGGFVLGRIK